MTTSRPSFPPFDESGALAKVQDAEDAWKASDPRRAAAAYTVDWQWCNRLTFLTGRDKIVGFFADKWSREHDCGLRKSF